MKINRWFLLTACLLFATELIVESAPTELNLPSLLSDGAVLQRNKKVNVWGWAKPGDTVTVEVLGTNTTAVADAEGNWKLQVGPFPAGGPYLLTVSTPGKVIVLKNVLFGEVWVASGQSNMEYEMAQLTRGGNNPLCIALGEANQKEIATAEDPLLRQYTVSRQLSWNKPLTDCQGNWMSCSPTNTGKFSATGYYFAKVLRKELGVPVGLVKNAWGGSPIEPWMSPDLLQKEEPTRQIVRDWEQHSREYDEQIQKDPEQKKQKSPRDSFMYPSTLFNGMLSPIHAYTIAGAIWYQGEGNANKYGLTSLYSTQFMRMITEWRTKFNQGDFPFLFVQLSPYEEVSETPREAYFAEIRDEQRKTLALTNTGMAVTTDIGENDNIHAKNKQDVGYRLALWTLGNTYGKKVPEVSGPLYRDSRIDGKSIILTFDHAGKGLMVGKKVGTAPTEEVKEDLRWFQIAGEDRKWVWAQAKITGKNTVSVSSDEVAKPVAVRYAWSSGLTGVNFYNRAGLPASPFRTDDWPWVHGDQ